MGEIRRRDDCADPASYRLYLQGADSSQAMQDQSMTTETSDRILRIKTVLKCTGLSRSTLYRKIDEGKFPKQVRIATRCTGWRQSAVNEWLRNPMFYSVDDYDDG